MSKLLIYMPALNEEKTIGSVLNSVPKEIKGFSEIFLLVVDDGSTDNTVAEARSSKAMVLSHNQNKGVGIAFQTAIKYALGQGVDVLVSIDADGQFDVDQILELTKPIIQNETDFCIGNRFSKGKPVRMPALKYWGNKRVNKIISWISKTKIHDASCGFRAYSRECLMNLNLQGSFTYTHETILDLINKGFCVKQVPVDVIYYEGRVSRVANNLIGYAIRTSKIIVKCLKDYAPFYFFMYIALILLFMAACMGGFVLVHWLLTGDITPYKSIGIIALSLCGMFVLMVVLALVADMLGRMRDNQEKILYFLKKNEYEDKG